jgi:hypothetical protein
MMQSPGRVLDAIITASGLVGYTGAISIERRTSTAWSLLGCVVLLAVGCIDGCVMALGVVLTLTCGVGLLFRGRRRVAGLGWTRGRFSPCTGWA